MGTLLEASGAPESGSLELLTLADPALVQSVHTRYLEAGAQIITTNSFSASALGLKADGAADKVRHVNRQAARLAREARELLGVDALVSGSVGPLRDEDVALPGRLSEKRARALLAEQISALVEGGVDLIALETFFDLDDALLALEVARSLCDLPVVAMLTFDDDARTAAGQTAAEAAAALWVGGAAAVGANCGTGPRGVLSAVRMMAEAVPGFPLAAMPNAGMPTRSHRRLFFPTGTEYAAAFAREAVALGARLVGGCCGMGPEHIAAMRAAIGVPEQARPVANGPGVRVLSPDRPGAPPATWVQVPVAPPAPAVQPDGRPSVLASKLAAREFVVSIEMHPPRTHLVGSFLKAGQEYRDAGVELVNIVDSPMARVRMSSLAACALVQERVGLETITHLTPRDRTLLGLQSELIGAYALGVRNILCVTGDPHRGNLQLGTVNVYDVDAIGMIKMLAGYNRGVDVKGSEMGQPTRFVIGGALNPNAPDLDLEIERFHQKVAEGVQYIMVQPVFDMEVLVRMLDRLGRPRVPIIAGICPIHSYQHALLLHNEIPGIRLTDEVLERMRKAESNAEQEGIAIARDLLAAAREVCQGVYIMPSYGRHWMALRVLE